MAKISTKHVGPGFLPIVLVAYGVAILMLLAGNRMVSGQCQGDMQGLMEQCARYVQKTGPKSPPSQACCGFVKTVDLPCICNHITDQVEKVISMEKATYVAQFCGKGLAHGTKCGSYTVP